MASEIVRHESGTLGLMASAVAPGEIIDVINHVHEIVKKAMKPGKVNPQSGEWNGEGDFVQLPGTKKLSLLKPGVEKLALGFRLSGVIRDIQETELGNGHLEVTVQTNIVEIGSGRVHAVGFGSCSTMESKYRYLGEARVCPKCGKAAIIKGKSEYGGGWLCYKKKDGCGEKFKDGDVSIESQAFGKVERMDISDTRNTVRKMAKKRSFQDGILQATASSGMFDQAFEEGLPELDEKAAQGSTEAPPPPQASGSEEPQSGKPAPDLRPTVKVDAAGNPLCPKCNGPMWDNRKARKTAEEDIAAGKRTKAAPPAWSCKDKDICKGTIWPCEFKVEEAREPGQEG